MFLIELNIEINTDRQAKITGILRGKANIVFLVRVVDFSI